MAADRECRRCAPAWPWPPAGRRTDRSFGCTSAQCAPAELFSADQWIGTNSEPSCCRSLTMTRSTAAPCAVSTRASIACSRPSAAASLGCTSTNGSATCTARRGLMPVRVMVCHWSRTRPVLSTNGQSVEAALASRAGADRQRGAPRPDGNAKPPSANSRSVPDDGLAHRPLHRRQRVVVRVAERRRGRRCRTARAPSFSKPDSAACSRNMSAAER